MRIVLSRLELDDYILNVVASILLFFYIYTPVVIYFPVNFGYLSLLIAIVYFSFRSNIKKLLALINNRVFLTFVYFYAFCIVYTVLVLLFSTETGNTGFLITFVRLLIDVIFIIPFFVIVFKDDLRFDLDRFLKRLLTIGVIQGVLSLIMLAIPALKDFVFAYLFVLPSDKLLAESYRGFGVASDFYFSMPLFQALIFAINTKFYFEKGNKYLLNYPFLLISMLLNARTSIIIIPVLFIVILVMSFYYDELKWMRKLSRMAMAGLVFIVIIIIYFLLNPDKLSIVEYLLEGITGIFAVLSGTGSSSTLDIILRKHLHVPHETSQIIFGAGAIVFGNDKSPVESDLGYIRYIYYGGILLSALFYFNIYNFAKSCILLAKDRFLKIILISATVTIFLVHFKGDVFNSSAFLKGVLILQVFILYKNENSCSIIKK